MANILYGISGEGSGHSSRAMEIARYLLGKGHKVKMLSYARGYKNLAPYFDVEEIFGLCFYHKNNKVKYLPTVVKNFLKSKDAALSLKKTLKITKEFKPDLIFTDFEPISAIVAKTKRLPLISIGNQHRITRLKIGYPMKYRRDANIAKSIIRMMIIKANAYLVTSFSDYKIVRRNTSIFPPILRREILETRPEKKDYILIYATFGFEELIPILKNINKKFIIYGFNISKSEDNLIFKKHSQEGFIEDLSNCEAIIANAGFTLISEALYLNKPYLAIPIAGHFEQVLNAHTLKEMGCGDYHLNLTKEIIESFLANLDSYLEKLKKYRREDNSKIFNKIDELISEHTSHNR